MTTHPDRLYVDVLTDDEQDTLDRLWAQLREREPRNLLRASYYDGKRAIRQVGSVIPPQYYRLGLVLGWSGRAVDAMARRCNFEDIYWPDGDLDGLGWREFRDANHLRAEIKSALVSSLIHGPAFLVNTVGDTSVDEPQSLLHVKDAMNATGTWNRRRRRLDDLLSVTERDERGLPTAFTLYLDGLTVDAWREAGRWQVERTGHPWGVPAEALVYKPRVGREFGSSRISRPLMSLHDQALRTVIRMEGHMDVYSFPEMWMLGADESIFKNADGSQKAAWQVVLGRIKGIPDDEEAANPRADVKQFPASSPSPHLAHLNALAKMFAREASLGDESFALTDYANPTSEGAQVQGKQDLIAECEGATEDWDVPLLRSVARGLAIHNGLNGVPSQLASLESKWRPPVYESQAAQADAGQKRLAAAPWLAETEVGLELLGLSPQQIKRALADRRRNRGIGRIADIVNTRTAAADGDVAL